MFGKIWIFAWGLFYVSISFCKWKRARKLQIYNSEFINNKYEKRISDIIYKEKEKEIYYLIEHQSKVDINMPNRILEYCMELMKEVKKN